MKLPVISVSLSLWAISFILLEGGLLGCEQPILAVCVRALFWEEIRHQQQSSPIAKTHLSFFLVKQLQGTLHGILM